MKDLYHFFIDKVKNNQVDLIINELKTSSDFQNIIFHTFFFVEDKNIFQILEQITGYEFVKFEETSEEEDDSDEDDECGLYSDIDMSVGFKD